MTATGKPRKLLEGSGRFVLDLLFPAQCARCADTIDQPGNLCARCWQETTFISPPFCACCGHPFEYEVGTDMLCGRCLAAPPPYTSGRSVFEYNEHSKGMVLSFKHADRTDQAPVFAKWMARMATDILKEDVLIVPVPLHSRRLVKRRYNQAALLALSIGKISRRKVIPDLLVRKRATASQGSKSYKGRFRNVKGAFALNPRWMGKISDQHIVLIDDVYTTGATVSACSECLLRQGASQISVLTLCRVVRPTVLSI